MSKVIPSMDSTTKDIVADNLSQLKQLFPEAFTEGKVDFDTLREVLGDRIEDREERYSFTWNGKNQARRLAQTPSTGTLRPCEQESVDWDSTGNLFIEGDNLEVLKLLQKSYHKKVKMIYIDPPYNTGNDFVYEDDFSDNLKNYKEITGQVDEGGRPYSDNPETSGRYHTNWLNMMYPRLKLARNLLKDDGIIFISIDDNEVANLRKICDEIFGEDNVDQMIWNKEAKGSSGTLKQTIRFRVNHENIILAYKEKVKVQFQRVSEPLVGREKELHTANLAVNKDSVNKNHKNWFELISPTGINWINHWKFDKKQIDDLIAEDLIYWGKDNDKQPRLILPMDERRKIFATSLINKSGTTEGRKDFEDLMPPGVFSYPKPLELIQHLLEFSVTNDEIILDFFAGSSSSAQAVLNINFKESNNRKFIMVQLPEIICQENYDYIEDFKNIAEISKERIRRASTKIREKNPDYKGDLGFKVFKLDSTNIKYWESDFNMSEQDLLDQIYNIKPDRTEIDLLYEVIIKSGFELTLPITEHSVDGQTVYEIDSGKLVVCVSDNITLEVVEGIAKLKDQLKQASMSVVLKDTGFAGDVVKTNAMQILKQAGIKSIWSL